MSAGDDTGVGPLPAQLTDDPLPLPLAAMLSGNDPMALLMSQLDTSNPQAAMMLRMMDERNRARANELQTEEQEQAAAAAAQREDDFEELRDTVQRACAELDVLRERLGALSDALGACRLCFGSDPACQACRGRGSPGGRAPVPAAFRLYVLPAVRRAQKIQARHQQSRQAPSITQDGQAPAFQPVRPQPPPRDVQ